jgi:hypothetical protein
MNMSVERQIDENIRLNGTRARSLMNCTRHAAMSASNGFPYDCVTLSSCSCPLITSSTMYGLRRNFFLNELRMSVGRCVERVLTVSDWLICLFSISTGKCASTGIYRFRRAFDIAERENNVVCPFVRSFDVSYCVEHTNRIVNIVFEQTIEPFEQRLIQTGFQCSSRQDRGGTRHNDEENNDQRRSNSTST